MNNDDDMTDIECHYDDVPKGWAVCCNDQCPRAAECLRHLVYTLAPNTEQEHQCVLPQAWREGECRKFAEARPQTLAWGMKGIFHNIPKWQATAIRHELQLLFGSEPTYFRYRRGEYLITPERQAEIAAIFARYGYTQPLQYDHMKTAYYFPSPGFGTYHSNKTRHTYEKLSRLS